jgi:hypothetical protein
MLNVCLLMDVTCGSLQAPSIVATSNPPSDVYAFIKILDNGSLKVHVVHGGIIRGGLGTFARLLVGPHRSEPASRATIMHDINRGKSRTRRRSWL